MSINEAKFPSEPLAVFGAEVFKGINIRNVPKKILVTSFLLDNGLEEDNRSWEARYAHYLFELKLALQSLLTNCSWFILQRITAECIIT